MIIMFSSCKELEDIGCLSQHQVRTKKLEKVVLGLPGVKMTQPSEGHYGNRCEMPLEFTLVGSEPSWGAGSLVLKLEMSSHPGKLDVSKAASSVRSMPVHWHVHKAVWSQCVQAKAPVSALPDCCVLGQSFCASASSSTTVLLTQNVAWEAVHIWTQNVKYSRSLAVNISGGRNHKNSVNNNNE
jgi:hypothetical protein